MRWLTEANVPRRIAWRVMMPNQISIWFIQLDPTGVKWKVTFGLACQPGLDLGSVVSGQVVQDDVDLLAARGV